MTQPLPAHHPLRTTSRWLVLGGLVVALAGCASLHPGATPATDLTPPSGWRAAPAEASASPANLARWWTRFNDPDLTALVEQALKANTSVNSARAALAQARAQRDVQAAQLGPTLGATASARRSKSGSQDAGNSFQAGFDAGWEPDVFGSNRSATDASEADARAAASSLGNAQVSLAAEVAVNLIELRGLQARLAIAQSNLAAQTETLQITRWRAQAGLAASLDVEQAVAASEQTAAQLPALQSGMGQALNALAVLTGELPGTLSDRLGAARPIPQAPAELALAFPADTLRQRPDVRSAEQRAVAALARVAVADAARYPSFRLSGSLGLSALTLSGLTGGASVVNSLLASVSAPLFDGGAALAQVRAQEAAAEQARLAYRAAVLAALQEVEDTLLSLQANRERLGRLQAASAAAANADLLARQRFQSGLIDFTTVLSTQRTLLSAQDSVASTQASLSADHVRLYKALGGGWTPDADPENRGGWTPDTATDTRLSAQRPARQPSTTP
jgi:NodT family efflux transporter outer membrane factor (OMF) lipoprotein